MAVSLAARLRSSPAREGARPAGRRGDATLRALSAAAGVLAVVVLADIAYQVITGAQPALSRYGLGFVGHAVWAPNFDRYGAAVPLYGTLVTSVIALLIATPLGIAIALYLALMARPAVRAVVGPLVEMLAAVPSVIVGFWGVVVLAPFVQATLEPPLHSLLGFTGLFGTQQGSGVGLFTAGLVLAFMILPILASLSRDLFLTVPPELRDGAEALGATRWEVIRGIVLPSTASGVAAATMLGLGRALGEAIAVLEVVGAGNEIHGSLFLPGITLASRIANDFVNPLSSLQTAALFYLAALLLVITVAANLAGQAIGRRFDVHAAVAR